MDSFRFSLTTSVTVWMFLRDPGFLPEPQGQRWTKRLFTNAFLVQNCLDKEVELFDLGLSALHTQEYVASPMIR